MRPMTTMPFGKHKGKLLTAIPAKYLKWLLRECDLHADLQADIQAVVKGEPLPLSLDERIQEFFGGE